MEFEGIVEVIFPYLHPLKNPFYKSPADERAAWYENSRDRKLNSLTVKPLLFSKFLLIERLENFSP